MKCSAAQLKHTPRRNISAAHSRKLGKLLTATVDCKTEFRSPSDPLVRKFRSALFVRVVSYCWILSPASAFCSELPFPSLLFCNTKFRAECWKRERRRDGNFYRQRRDRLYFYSGAIFICDKNFRMAIMIRSGEGATRDRFIDPSRCA